MPGGCKAPLTHTKGASRTSHWRPIYISSSAKGGATNRADGKGLTPGGTGRAAWLLRESGSGPEVGAEGSEEAKKLGGQCPLPRKPRGAPWTGHWRPIDISSRGTECAQLAAPAARWLPLKRGLGSTYARWSQVHAAFNIGGHVRALWPPAASGVQTGTAAESPCGEVPSRCTDAE